MTYKGKPSMMFFLSLEKRMEG